MNEVIRYAYISYFTNSLECILELKLRDLQDELEYGPRISAKRLKKDIDLCNQLWEACEKKR